jgi:SSS family solute:Na+ symporter
MTFLAASSVWSNPYVIFTFVYLLALLGVGVYKTKSVKNSEDFMVAGRTLPWYILVGSLLATWIGNGSLFGGAGLGYRNGPAGMWSSGGAWLAIVLVFFIAKRIRSFGKVTIPDIFEARYGGVAAKLAMITTIIAYLTIVSYQFKGGGLVLNIITEGELSVSTGIMVTAAFAIAYTVLAGMFSVVYTDVVNGVLMTIGTLGGLFYMINAVGGMDEVQAVAESAGKWRLWGNWSEERPNAISGPILALSFFVPTMLLLLGDANMYQRIFSARDGGSARKAVFFWVIGVVILEAAVSFMGLVGSVAVEKGMLIDAAANNQAAAVAAGDSAKDVLSAFKLGSESIIPNIAMHGLPLILGLLLVGTMMAIIVSTADSFLLIPATNLTRDVYQKIKPQASERSVLLVSRLFVLGLGGVALLLVSQFKTVLDAAYTAYNIYGASITPALLAVFFWKRATATGAVASIVGGALITIVWTWGIDPSGFHPFFVEATFPAAMTSIGALVIGSLITPAPPRSVWGQFFGDGPPKPTKQGQTQSLYELEARSLEGGAAPLSTFSDQVTLVVNLASECGLTPQYEGLQKLHAELGDRGFSVLGFPSNEFGGQEPGDPATIQSFCEERFSVTFPLHEKCHTGLGPNQSPVYALLGSATGELPRWNFAKYLVGRDGTVLSFHGSEVTPEELRAAVEDALGESKGPA